MSSSTSTSTSANGDISPELLKRIGSSRSGVERFVRELETRGARLSSWSLICSAIATGLTAIPAFDGPGFTTAAASFLHIPDDSDVWRALCLTAMLLSIISIVLSLRLAQRQLTERLDAAKACQAKLEGLETLLASQRLEAGQAAELYQQYLAAVAFIQDEPTPEPVARPA